MLLLGSKVLVVERGARPLLSDKRASDGRTAGTKRSGAKVGFAASKTTRSTAAEQGDKWRSNRPARVWGLRRCGEEGGWTEWPNGDWCGQETGWPEREGERAVLRFAEGVARVEE